MKEPKYDPTFRRRVGLTCNDPSRTKQSFKDECDINRIMRRYLNTGIPPPMNTNASAYGDFTTVDDYFDAVTRLREAQNQFDALPAHLRRRFNNAPSELLMFILNSQNRAEAIELGLIPKPPGEPAPTKVEIVNAPAGQPQPPTPPQK